MNASFSGNFKGNSVGQYSEKLNCYAGMQHIIVCIVSKDEDVKWNSKISKEKCMFKTEK